MACPVDRYSCLSIVCFLAIIISVLAIIVNRAGVVNLYKFGNQFDPATCRVGSVGYVPEERHCTLCETDRVQTCTRSVRTGNRICRSKKRQRCEKVYYPCLRINVTYDLAGDGVWTEALLYYDQSHLLVEEECSYRICDRNANHSRSVISAYAAKFEDKSAESTFPCYVNMEDRTQVINSKIVTRRQVIHGYLWPSLVLTVAIIGMVAVQYKVYRNRKQKERQDREKRTVKSSTETVPLQSTNMDNQQPAHMPPPTTYQTQGHYQPGYMPPQQYPPPTHAGYYPPSHGMPPQPQTYPQAQTYPPPQGGSYPMPQGGAPIHHPPPGGVPLPYPNHQVLYPSAPLEGAPIYPQAPPEVMPSPFITPKV